ncbi:hypothetical protein [Tunturiibacter gelidiferens]|uniref:Uncharacterized protein n=1 Tax=Tunturiibacter gelidiferens TaxID=3069689 RepID=A0AAU7YVE3_9BACT
MLPAPSPPWSSRMPSSSQKPDEPQRTEQQQKLRIIARQKRLVTDANKLLLLATDLKAQVDKPSTDTLSVDMIKRADEIERLARGVKNQMKR